jgi:hypothetical protein
MIYKFLATERIAVVKEEVSNEKVEFLRKKLTSLDNALNINVLSAKNWSLDVDGYV